MVVLLHAMDPNKRRKVESSVSMGSYSVTGQHSINGGEESHEERSGEINSPSYAEFKSIVLSRNFLAKYCHVPFFAKLVLGYFIRFQLEPGKYHLFRVDGIEKGPKYYALTLSNGQKKNSRVNLHAFDVCRQPPKAVSLPISGVSNSPPTETEYHQALTTIHETARENFDDLKKMGLTSISPSFLNTKTHVLEKIVKRTWYCPLTRDVLALLKDTQERIIRDQEKGLASHVKAQEQNPVPWGGHNQSKHRCRILFRSWIARPTVPQANLVDVKLPGESGMDEHGNRYGTGMSDEIQKYSGRYCYLFYHSKNDRLQPLECPADLSYDELQPEITAWRAARQILGYIPLKYFKYAIISRIDCVREPQENESFTSRRACISPAATRAGVNQEDVKEDIDKYGRRYVTNTDEEALQHFIVVDPPTPAYRDWASTNRATGSGGRILESAEQLFFVDLDVLLRVEAISPSTIRDNVSRFQSLIPGRTNVWPSQVLWVPEDVLIKTQKGEESQYHGIHICQSLTQAMLCEFSAYQHPFIYPRRNGNKVRLYHGTSPSSAVRILEDGFKKPTCKKTEECKTGNCCCQMEGFGIYFGRCEKGLSFADKLAESLPESQKRNLMQAVKRRQEKWQQSVPVSFDESLQSENNRGTKTYGALIEVVTDLGHCKVAQRVPDPQGIRGSFTKSVGNFLDHNGTWYAWEGYDSLYLRDNSKPASTTAEWCVVDPQRIRIVGVHIVCLGYHVM